MGIRDLIAILTLIGLCGGAIAYGNNLYVSKDVFKAEQSACKQRADDLKEILVEMKADIKEIRKEQRREGR